MWSFAPGCQARRSTGLSSDAVLTVVTEFYGAPAPQAMPATEANPEPILRWGPMGMVQGKAFSVGQEPVSGVDVRKHWIPSEENSLLLESVPHHRIRAKVEALPRLETIPLEQLVEPEAEGAGLPFPPLDSSSKGLESLFAPLPGHETVMFSGNGYEMAALELDGFVIDYTLTLTARLINIDFASGGKTGFAAVGQYSWDTWNTCNSGTTSLVWSDGQTSGASVTINNLPGSWSFTCCMPPIDAMYDGYLYAYSSSGTVTINSLPAGTYNFYLYGHGPAQNANTIFTMNGVQLSTSSSGNYWNTADWQEGHQYVVFRDVYVSGGSSVSFSVAPGVSGYALLNGMQIVPSSAMPAPPQIIYQPANVTAAVGQSATFSVGVAGTWPMYYQWRKDGQNISGATQSSHTISSVQTADAGSYSVYIWNSVGVVFSSSATLTVTSSGTCATPPLNLVGWWPADGDGANLAGGAAATLCNQASFGSGIVANSFEFDGVNDYAQVPDSDQWAFGSSDFTIEFWARFKSWSPSGSIYQPEVIFVGNDEGGGPTRKWFFALSNGYLTLHVNYPGQYSRFLVCAPFAPALNTWYHLAVVRSGNTVYIYRNGQSTGNPDFFDKVIPNPAAPLTFGQAETLGFMNGFIDEVAIYRRALTQTELSTIYAAGSAGKCKGALEPSITAHPVHQTALQGGTASFNVTASGFQPLSYQWYGNGTAVGGNSATLNLTSVQPGMADSYYARVSNSAGSANSNPASLTVLADSDGDGMWDTWENLYFGSLLQNATGDYDGDGRTNQQEYQAGTNPVLQGNTLEVFTPWN